MRKLIVHGNDIIFEGETEMEKFVLAGKAKTVFRLIELKAKREEAEKRDKKQNKK